MILLLKILGLTLVILLSLSMCGLMVGFIVASCKWWYNDKRTEKELEVNYWFNTHGKYKELDAILLCCSLFYIYPIIIYVKHKIDQHLEKEKEFQEYISDGRD